MITVKLKFCILASLTFSFASSVHISKSKTSGNELSRELTYQLSSFLPDNPTDYEEHCSELENLESFKLWDYFVVIGMLAISLGIGVFYGFFDKSSGTSAEDFMLGTEMSVFPVTLSLTTSFITAIELLGNPAEIFFNGGQFALIVVSMILVIPFALKVFFPIYDEMKLTSCYEYLGARFGKEMRIFGGVLYIVQMCFYTSVSVLAPAIALSKATGLNTRLAIVLIYIVCVFYSSQGGLKAVVIADTFQTCVLVLSLLLVVIVGTYMHDGGISEIFKIASDNNRLNLLSFDPNPTTRHSVFSVVLGGFFYWGSLLCVNQATVQKAMSLRNLSKARIALTLSIVGLALVFLINFYTGIMTFAYYSSCDPLRAGKIDGIDQMMPFYIMEAFGHITSFVGIFVAGVFAASLGTVAACLSSLSAVTIEDLLISGLNVKISAESGARYAKWMNFGYGVVSFCLIFLVEGRSILQATLTLNGLIGGILLGLFSLGIFFQSANLKGALFGGLLSTVCVITLGIFALTFGKDEPFLDSSTDGCNCVVNGTSLITDELYRDEFWYQSIFEISYMWYSMVGTLLTISFGLLISSLTSSFEKRRITKVSKKTKRYNNNNSKSSSRRQSVSMPNEIQKTQEKSWEEMLYHQNNADRNINNDETMQVGQMPHHGLSVVGRFTKNGDARKDVDNPVMSISDENIRK